MTTKIVTLPGDGIGPEVTHQAVRVLQAVAQKTGQTFEFEEKLIGGCAIDATGSALPDDSLQACESADAVLLGAVGGPKWDDPRAATRPEDGLLKIRKALHLFANLRPVKPHPALVSISPLRPEKLEGVDFIVVRELTGGLYFGKPKERRITDNHHSAVDTLEYHDYEIKRIVELAFRLAAPRRCKVTSVDKANILATSRLWRELATEVGKAHPHITLDHLLVDTAAMRLVSSPSQFDVVVTENTFGDILTDEAAVLVGSMGLLPSASLGSGTRGLYEPIHGSAPDIAGKGIANPLGSILSGAMLLRYSLNREADAAAIERAVDETLTAGYRTADLVR
ncbi:MAG: 3-isopropylmalate dehydrogenase, partial [Anaerolineae bacterium]